MPAQRSGRHSEYIRDVHHLVRDILCWVRRGERSSRPKDYRFSEGSGRQLLSVHAENAVPMRSLEYKLLLLFITAITSKLSFYAVASPGKGEPHKF